MEDDNRTMYDLVRNVMDAAHASNLSGVVHSFSRDIRRLRTLMQEGGYNSTDMLNRHPVCIMWAQVISNITQWDAGLTFSDCYNWCGTVKERGPEADPKSYPPLPGFQTNGQG